MHYAGADMKALRFIRIGTSGGVGCAPGTVVLTSESIDPTFVPGFEQVLCGVKYRFPATADTTLVKELAAAAADIPTLVGKTVCTDDFYEAQSRIDGALHCGFTLEDKMAWLKRASELGVKNIEME